MNPNEFAGRMHRLCAETRGDPRERDVLALGLMRDCLHANGFAHGLAVLDAYSPERIGAGDTARAVSRG